MYNSKKQLENFSSLLREFRKCREQGGLLRFERAAIVASDVAAQFYCEKKVEMQYVYGKIETESKNVGTEAHTTLAQDSGKVNRQGLWEKIYSNKPIFALEMFLLAKYNDAFLVGKPDSVLFKNGFPLVLFEYKFSKSDVAFPSYHVQAQTYCIMLAKMGFNVSRLFYAIVVADPKTKGNSTFRMDAKRKVIANRSRIATHSIEGAKIYLNKFNNSCAEMDLTWALEFWSKKREAKPTNNLNKCDRCEYKMKCQQSRL
jgi:hypothetical protein